MTIYHKCSKICPLVISNSLIYITQLDLHPDRAYEINIKIPEFTFLGVQEQPDFATIYLTFYPQDNVIELKALKYYVYQLRDIVVSYERLPMLEIVFDRLVRMMTTSLRNFTSDNVEVSLDNISSIRFGDYLNSIPLPAILAVFRAEQLDNYGLLTVDSNLIYSIVDVLLGGHRGTAAMRVEGRPYTTIERQLVQKMIKVVLEDAQRAFAPLTKVDFTLDRIETNPRFAAIARSANAAILVRLRIDMEDRGGRIELMLPYSTLEPIRKLLLQQFMGEKFGRDNIWESHLASQLWTTAIDVQAVLDDYQAPLSTVMWYYYAQCYTRQRHQYSLRGSSGSNC